MEKVNCFRGETNTISYTFSFKKALLHIRNNTWHNWRQSICNDFRNDFEFEVGKGYGPELINNICLRSLGNQDKKVGVEVGKDPIGVKELSNCCKNIMIDHIPVVLEKRVSKAMWPWSSIFVKTKDFILDFQIERILGKHIVDIISNSPRDVWVDELISRLMELELEKSFLK